MFGISPHLTPLSLSPPLSPSPSPVRVGPLSGDHQSQLSQSAHRGPVRARGELQQTPPLALRQLTHHAPKVTHQRRVAREAAVVLRGGFQLGEVVLLGGGGVGGRSNGMKMVEMTGTDTKRGSCSVSCDSYQYLFSLTLVIFSFTYFTRAHVSKQSPGLITDGSSAEKNIETESRSRGLLT